MFSTTEADEVLVSEESVEAGISLASLAHEAGEGHDRVFATGHLAVLVNLKQGSESMNLSYLGDLDLDGSVVLGGDESVGGGALAGDVEIHNLSFVVLHLLN